MSNLDSMLRRNKAFAAQQSGAGTLMPSLREATPNLKAIATEAALNRPSANKWRAPTLIFFCALLTALPLAIRGNSCGHDFDFHIQSWMATTQQWHEGVFYPHWVEGANYGAGEPRFVFYPPITWIFGALLGMLLPWTAVPVAFSFVVIAGCGISMFKLAGEFMPVSAATLAACAYMLNPYMLFVAYERTAYGELAAGIWLPLVVLDALPALPGAPPLASEMWVLNKHILPLALVIAGIWLTNAPAAVMSCYLLAAIGLWKAVSLRDWAPILHSAAGLLLGLGLAAFYLVPAAYERRWVDIARAIAPGMSIQDSFLFAHTGEAFHDQVLRTASWIFVTMLVTISIAIGIAWKRGVPKRLLLPLRVAAALLLALQLPWSRPLWNLAPELKFLQFPWRWSLLLGLVLSLATGFAAASGRATVAEPRARKTILRTLLLFAAAIAIVATGTRFFWQPCDQEDAVSAQLAVFRAGTGFEGTDEYTSLGADNSVIPSGLPPAIVLRESDSELPSTPNPDTGIPTFAPETANRIAAKIEVARWASEQKAVTLTTQSPGYAVLRLMDYPAWQLSLNGANLPHRFQRNDGLMTIPLPAGPNRLEVRYTATRDVLYGRALSAASLLAWLTLAVAARRRNRLRYHEFNAS